MFGAEWVDGSVKKVYQWSVEHHQGDLNNILLGFILDGHPEDVDKQWFRAGRSYGHRWNSFIIKDGQQTVMKEPSISEGDCLVYTLDLIQRQIRVRVNDGDDVVLFPGGGVFRRIKVGNGVRYKLAMHIHDEDESVTVTRQIYDAQKVQIKSAEKEEEKEEVQYEKEFKINRRIKDDKEGEDIRRCLAMVVCVGDYTNSKEKMNSLPSTKADKANLMRLFEKECEFTVIRNRGHSVDTDEWDDLVYKAQKELKNAAKYDAFIFAFSGHGDIGSIILSDGESVDRNRLLMNFDGAKCKKFGGKLKLYLIDACQGGMNVPTTSSTETKGTAYVNPDRNTIVLNANTPGFASKGQEGKGGFLIRAFCAELRGIEDRMNLNDITDGIQERFQELTNGNQELDVRNLGVIGRKLHFSRPTNLSKLEDKVWRKWSVRVQFENNGNLLVEVSEKNSRLKWRNACAPESFGGRRGLAKFKEAVDDTGNAQLGKAQNPPLQVPSKGFRQTLKVQLEGKVLELNLVG